MSIFLCFLWYRTYFQLFQSMSFSWYQWRVRNLTKYNCSEKKRNKIPFGERKRCVRSFLKMKMSYFFLELMCFIVQCHDHFSRSTITTTIFSINLCCANCRQCGSGKMLWYWTKAHFKIYSFIKKSHDWYQKITCCIR